MKYVTNINTAVFISIYLYIGLLPFDNTNRSVILTPTLPSRLAYRMNWLSAINYYTVKRSIEKEKNHLPKRVCMATIRRTLTSLALTPDNTIQFVTLLLRAPLFNNFYFL